MALIQIPELFRQSVAALSENLVALRLYSAEGDLLARYGAPRAPDSRASLAWSTRVTVAGQDWRLQALPGYAFQSHQAPRQAYLVLALGSLFALISAVYLITLSREIGQRRRAEARLRELAVRDSVTGLVNRIALFRQLRLEFARAKRYGRPLSVVMLDLDHFKSVNDTYGHAAGDAVLRRVGATIRECLRRSDVAGRYGGEEICLVLPETDAPAASALAERIRAAVAALKIPIGDDRTIGLTLSAGVAGLAAGTQEPQELVRAADAALYRAKEQGRDRVHPGPGRRAPRARAS